MLARTINILAKNFLETGLLNKIDNQVIRNGNSSWKSVPYINRTISFTSKLFDDPCGAKDVYKVSPLCPSKGYLYKKKPVSLKCPKKPCPIVKKCEEKPKEPPKKEECKKEEKADIPKAKKKGKESKLKNCFKFNKKSDAPKKEEPKKAEVKKEPSKTEPPKKEPPKTEPPKKEPPKTEPPKKVEVKQEEPKKVEVKKEEPKQVEAQKKIETKKEEVKCDKQKVEPKKDPPKKETPRPEPPKEDSKACKTKEEKLCERRELKGCEKPEEAPTCGKLGDCQKEVKKPVKPVPKPRPKKERPPYKIVCPPRKPTKDESCNKKKCCEKQPEEERCCSPLPWPLNLMQKRCDKPPKKPCLEDFDKRKMVGVTGNVLSEVINRLKYPMMVQNGSMAFHSCSSDFGQPVCRPKKMPPCSEDFVIQEETEKMMEELRKAGRDNKKNQPETCIKEEEPVPCLVPKDGGWKQSHEFQLMRDPKIMKQYPVTKNFESPRLVTRKLRKKQ